MKNLRIIFYGTPDFATTILRSLVENQLNIIAVVTAPDRPAGRGRSLKASSVKEYALSVGLPVFQPENLKKEQFLNDLSSLEPDLQIVVAFRMLPKQVWTLPKLGTFNLHASLLPQYRGAAPINWAIINGEKQTGLTTFFIDEKIDTGEMILSETVEILPSDNAGTLHDRLMNTGSLLVLKTVALIASGEVKTTPQPVVGELKSAPKLTPENTRIDWNQPAEQVHNKIRGLSPYPAAWTILVQNGEELLLKIYESNFIVEKHSDAPGTILVKKSTLFIATPDGYIESLNVQLPGKKRMDVKSLLNGFKFSSNSKVL